MDYKHRHFAGATVVFACLSCIILWIIAIINCVAFGTRVWLESDGYSPFQRIGFFSACFDKCGRPYCPVGDDDMFLDRCYNLWPWFQDDYYIQEQWDWLTPEWFKTCRVLVIVNIPITFISAFLLTFTSFITLAEYASEETDRKSDAFIQITLYIAAALNLLAGILSIFAVSQFYANAFLRDWMPMPYKNHLGYSFYLEVVCGAFLILSATFCLFGAMFKTIVSAETEKELNFEEDVSEG